MITRLSAGLDPACGPHFAMLELRPPSMSHPFFIAALGAGSGCAAEKFRKKCIAVGGCLFLQGM